MVEKKPDIIRHFLSVEQFKSEEGCRTALAEVTRILGEEISPVIQAAQHVMEERGLNAYPTLTIKGAVKEVVGERIKNHSDYIRGLEIKQEHCASVFAPTPLAVLELREEKMPSIHIPHLRVAVSPDDIQITFFKNGTPFAIKDFHFDDLNIPMYHEALARAANDPSQLE